MIENQLFASSFKTFLRFNYVFKSDWPMNAVKMKFVIKYRGITLFIGTRIMSDTLTEAYKMSQASSSEAMTLSFLR